jgi:hypothetical protein
MEILVVRLAAGRGMLPQPDRQASRAHASLRRRASACAWAPCAGGSSTA